MVLPCPESSQGIKPAALPERADPYSIKVMAKPDPTAASAVDPVADLPVEADPKASGDAAQLSTPKASKRPREIGGPSGPEPTRYGDWERNGRVSDF